jgi:hypothetical protein
MAAGMATDKSQLLNGAATSRTEAVTSPEASPTPTSSKPSEQPSASQLLAELRKPVEDAPAG